MIADSRPRRCIACALGINPVTLICWAHNESHQRQQNLRQLLRVLLQHSEVLLSLVQIEYPTFTLNDMQLQESEETRVDVIPADFYKKEEELLKLQLSKHTIEE